MIERNIWRKAGTATLILMNINVGVKKGNKEVITTRGVLGFCVTRSPIIKGTKSKMNIGVANCWASWSVFTEAPTIANNTEYIKYPIVKNITK